jgi:hypothetical protein
LCTKLTWLLKSLSSELFYPHCQEILQFKLIHRTRKLSLLAEPQDHSNQAAGCIFPDKGWDPLPGQNVKSWTSPQTVGIDNPLVLKTDTQEAENLDKAVFS